MDAGTTMIIVFALAIMIFIVGLWGRAFYRAYRNRNSPEVQQKRQELQQQRAVFLKHWSRLSRRERIGVAAITLSLILMTASFWLKVTDLLCFSVEFILLAIGLILSGMKGWLVAVGNSGDEPEDSAETPTSPG